MTLELQGGGAKQPRTVPQAAQELNVSVSTIRAWIGQRRIGCIRLGRAVRIPSREIARLLEAGFVPAKSSQ
jgi:excisionase family DNA binding protein